MHKNESRKKNDIALKPLGMDLYLLLPPPIVITYITGFSANWIYYLVCPLNTWCTQTQYRGTGTTIRDQYKGENHKRLTTVVTRMLLKIIETL